MRCQCTVGPGKFEGEPALTYIAWQSIMGGAGGATTGDEGESVEWMRAPFADPETVEAARAYGYCEECIREALEDRSAGMSLYESPQGFVYANTYATAKIFDRALTRAETADYLRSEQEVE